MVRNIAAAAALIAALAFCSPSYAQEQSGRFRYSLWDSEMGTKLRVTSGSTFGTKFSLNDLGMDKRELIEVWEFEMWEGSMKIDISYWEQKWEGYAQIVRDIAYEGITYNLSDVVDSSFKMRTTDVSFSTALTSSYKSTFSIVGGMKYIEYYSKLWDITASVVADEEVVAPIPYFGVSTEFSLGETTIAGGRFVIFQYAYNGTHVHVTNFYQVDAYVEFRAGTGPQSNTGLALRIGFRNMVISYENRTPGDRFEITQMMKGTYAAVYLSF